MAMLNNQRVIFMVLWLAAFLFLGGWWYWSLTLQAGEAKMLLLLAGLKQRGGRNKVGRDLSFNVVLMECNGIIIYWMGYTLWIPFGKLT